MADDMELLRLRIEGLLKQQGRSARSLSLAIGQNPAYIQQLVTGMRNKKPPSLDTMQAIADELAVSLAELREYRPPYVADEVLIVRAGGEPITDVDELAVLEEFAASALRGRGNLIPQNYDEMRPKRNPRKKKPEPHIFKLRISGNCMKDTVQDGEVVWFDTWLPREPVSLVLAVKDEHEAHIKRLVRRDGELWLESDDGWATRIDEHWRITAVAFTAQRVIVVGG